MVYTLCDWGLAVVDMLCDRGLALFSVIFRSPGKAPCSETGSSWVNLRPRVWSPCLFYTEHLVISLGEAKQLSLVVQSTEECQVSDKAWTNLSVLLKEPRPGIRKHHQQSLRGTQHGTQVSTVLSALCLYSYGSSIWKAGLKLSSPHRVGQARLVLPSHIQCQLWPFNGASQVTGEGKMASMQKHRNREAGPSPGVGPDNGVTAVCELGMNSHQPC